MILLQGGLCIDPASGLEDIRDILISDEKITAIETHIDPDSVAVPEGDHLDIYDCTGLIIGPGLVDTHVHFRDPGFTHKEDILTGAMAAARGGVTSVIMMANTKPAIDSPETLKYVLDKGSSTDIHVYSSATITKGIKGKELTDMKGLRSAGAKCFTDDGIPLLSADVARKAMEAAREIDAVLSFHEEDPSYIENNGINRGTASKYFGLGGSDRQAEISMVRRDIELAIATGAKINIQHISTAEAVDLIRQAKAAGHGDHIFAEATPHHMSMTEEDLISYGNYAKMNPPLRTEADRDAVIQGLVDGTIDCIATDHAPHTDEEKSLPIDKAPSGIIGLETALSVSYNTLIHCGYLSPLQLFCKLSLNPARIYGINAGELAIYRMADIVVFDPDRRWIFNKSQSKSFNSPLKNREITGDVVCTICSGRIIYNNMFEKKRKM